MQQNDGETLRPLGGYLRSLYAEKAWQGQWELFLLVRKWPSIVGTDLGRVTMPAYFRHDVLWVFVENSAWMQHAQLSKPKLLEQIKNFLSPRDLADIRWLLHPVSELAPRTAATSKQNRRVSPEREKAFREMASTVADEGCRKALLQLWLSFERDGS